MKQCFYKIMALFFMIPITILTAEIDEEELPDPFAGLSRSTYSRPTAQTSYHQATSAV